MLLAFAILFSPFSQAQFQVEVTAPRMMEASSVKVISAKKIQGLGHKNVLDVLKDEAGLDVAREGLGGQSSVFIRGGESSHTLVLIDGIEANDPSDPTRRFNFNLIEISDIESIEIIKGARSVQYGSDALAGVINIVTKKNLGLGKKELKARQEVGSFVTSKTHLNFRAKPSENFLYAVRGQYFSTEGYSVAKAVPGDKDLFHRARLGADAVVNHGKHELTFLGELQQLKQELDGGAATDDPNAKMESKNARAAVRYESVWGEDFFKPSLTFSTTRYARDYSDPADPVNTFASESTTNGHLNKADYSFVFEPSTQTVFKSKFTLGGEIQKEVMEIESQDATSRMGLASNQSFGEFLFGELKINQFEFYAGARTDKGQNFEHQENYRFAANYSAFSWWSFLTSWGTGFKSPTLYQYHAPLYGNPEVKPESSKSFDVGMKIAPIQEIKLESSFFVTEYENLILFNSTKTNRNYENTKEARIKGLEHNLSVNLIKELQLEMAYTYMEATDLSTHTPLPARSRHKGSVGLRSLWTENLSTNLSLSMVGRRRNSSSSAATNAGYGLVHLNSDYLFTQNLAVGIRIENFLDKEYVELAGYNTARRAYYGSLTYSFD